MRRSTSWLKGLVFSMLMALILPAYAHAQEGISVTIKELKTDQAATKLLISAAVTSLYELKNVKASVSDREVPLARSCSGCDWTGELPLTGLAKGPHTITVTAVDIYNSTGTGTGSFSYDEPPVVTRILPGDDHSVIRNNSLHVIAEAEDDLAQPSFFVEIGRDLRYPDIYDGDQGAGRFDRVYDVTNYNGSSLEINIYISDGVTANGDDNHRVNVRRTVHIESSPELVEMEREPEAQILDADESRLLLIRGGSLIIKDRSNGTETELLKGVTTNRSQGFELTPAGAVFLIDTGWYQMKLFWWNGEKLMSIPVESGSSWQVRGNYVAISDFGTLHWIDTETGTTRSISYPMDRNNFELEPSGSLLLEPASGGAQSNQILRYDPVTESTTTAFEYVGEPRGPVTDGQVILFTLKDGSLMKYLDGTVTEVVYGTTGAERMVPHVGYEANEGWLAYQQGDANNAGQLYLQSPTGTVTRATYFNTGATIQSLDNSGTLVLANNRQLYQFSQGMDKPTLIGGAAGVVKWIGGQLRYLLGDTIFTVKAQGPHDTIAPEWPAGEVLTVTDVTYNSAQLNWQPAMDDTGVDKYLMYRDNTLLDTLSGTSKSYEAKGLSPVSNYLFSLVAVDAAGNQSVKKDVTVTTAVYNPVPKAETLLYRFDGTILDFDQSRIVWKGTGDKVLWLYNRIDKRKVKVYDAAGSDYTISNAMLSADGVVYTLKSNGLPMTYYWKDGAVRQNWEGQTQYEVRGKPDGTVVYTSNGTTYLYSTQEGKLLYTFSGPGRLEYREHVFRGPGEKQYRYGVWYRLDGGSLYAIRI